MPAFSQLTAQVAACSRLPSAASPRRHLPLSAPGAQRAGGAAAARRAVVPLAGRYTGRSTDQQQPPPVPNHRLRTRRQSWQRRPTGSAETTSEFSAELFVLFGLPALVLVLSYAFNDPKALMISLPLLMLIPGIRDVLLSLCVDGIRAARNGWRFVSYDSQDEYERPSPALQRAEWLEAQAQRRAQAWLQAQGQQAPPPAQPPPPVWQAQRQPEWSRRVRRPPPPPPEYELRPGEYSIVSSGSTATPRSPFADGWPADGGFCDLPHSPFAPDWQAHLDQQQPPQQQQPYVQQPYLQRQQRGAWPPASPLASNDAWQDSMPAAAAERVAASRRRRAARRGGARSVATQAAAADGAEVQQAGRLVRPASKGRVGIDVGRERDPTPLLLRPVFALIPFLRYWGGFL